MNAYVIINEGCPLAISVQNPDQAEIVCGWTPNQSFEFVMHREALRALIELGTDALAEMSEAVTEESEQGATAC